MTRTYREHIGYVSRAPFLIVMPESKLWIGPYRCFHHAFAGRARQADPSKWFVVPASWKPPGWRRLDPWEGWVKLDEPHRFIYRRPAVLKPPTRVCKNGHFSPRYANRGCQQCRWERSRA